MAELRNRFIGRSLFTVVFVIPVLLLLAIPLAMLGAGLGAYLFFSHNLPEVPELMQYQPKTVSTFYADDGTVIGIFYKEKRFVVELEQMPPHVINAFLAAEDSRFYEHSGVDWQAMARAMVYNIKARRIVQGGSTISMQVTRNFLLTREKRYSRKIKEMLLAMELEKLWGKKRVLRIYLNEIYLGDGSYGVEAAARNYFDKPVEHLSIAEAATLAGLVASPAKYNPFKSVDLAEARHRTVLDRMLRFGFITREQYDQSIKEPLVFRKEPPRPFNLVPDFAEAVRRQVVEKYGEEALYNGGIKVFTTCKIDFQQKAIEAVQKGLEELRQRHKHVEIIRTVQPNQVQGLLEKRATPALKQGKAYQGVVTKVRAEKNRTILSLGFSPRLRGTVEIPQATSVYKVGQVLAVQFDKFLNDVPHFKIDTTPQVQGALVVMENRTGYVRAIVGGASSELYSFNRATQAKRQPGSAFKPIIYAAALEKKSYSPATIIVDESIEVELPGTSQEWEPRNAGGDFLGPISLRRALELSRNICTVKVLMDLGFDEVIRLAESMGVTSKLGRNLSLSLGSSEVTLLELVSAYTVFPNSGIYVQPVLIKRVEDRHGNVLEDNSNIPVLEAHQVPHPLAREEFRLLEEDEEQDEDSAPGGMEADTGNRSSTDNPYDREAQAATQDHTEQRLDTGEGHVAIPKSPEVGQGRENAKHEVRAVLSAETAYIMTNLLQGGIRSGTGSRMQQYLKRRDIAGKTGTTNNAADAWFIGFTPEYTAGVWVGYDEKRPLGKGEEGGRAALPIWGYFMREVLQGSPEKEFPVPPNISFVKMVTISGNTRQGFAPTTVEEPVYTPFVGRTLFLSPLDSPSVLSPYGQAIPPGTPGQFAPSPKNVGSQGLPPGMHGYPATDVRSFLPSGTEAPRAPVPLYPQPTAPAAPGPNQPPPAERVRPTPYPDARGGPPPPRVNPGPSQSIFSQSDAARSRERAAPPVRQ